MHEVTQMFSNAIEGLAQYHKISNDEIIVHLGYMLKERIKANTEFATNNPKFSYQALQTNKLCKMVLNDVINTIDKKRNVLRSLEKEVRKKYN